MRTNKPDQSTFVRIKEFEKSFKKRYGKETEIWRALTKDESGKVCRASVHIVTPKNKYVITETLTKEGKTDHVISGTEDKPHKYRTYLEAEVFVADLIGEENGIN